MVVLDLYAYADESGVQQSPAYCVVAGYIASPRAWDAFRQAWKAMLYKYQIDELHAKKFFGRKAGHGQYAHLAKEEASALIDDAINIINHHRLNPIGSIIDVEAFDKLTLGERRFLTGALRKGNSLWGTGSPNQSFYIPFKWFVQWALEYTPIGTKVHFVFDQQGQRGGLCLEIFDNMKRLGFLKDNGRLGDIIFANSKEKVEIQAADILSHLVYTYVKARSGLGRMNSERRVAIALLKRKNAAINMFNADALEKNFVGLEPEFRAYLHSVTL